MTNPTLTEKDVAEIAKALQSNDQVMFVNARIYPSGIWLGGRCKHLYAANLCRLTGELTALGTAVRNHLISTPNMPKGERA